MKLLKSILLIVCVALLFVACKKECSHQYQSQITRQATCTGAGEETFTCTLCKHSYTQAIPALEHSGTAVVEKEPTCSEEGLQKLQCTACGTATSEPIDKLPHDLKNITVTKEPNCTEQGEGIGDCAVCGAKQVAGELPTNDAHVFTDTVVRAATCTETGEGTRTCTLCQHTEPCTYPKKGHTYNQKTVVKPATCTQKGELQGVCADCGYTGKEVVSSLGHSWNNATCLQDKVCTTCGVGDGKGDHAYTILKEREYRERSAGYQEKKCSVCGVQKNEYYVKEQTIDLDAIGEEIAQYARSLGLNARIEKITDYQKRYTIPVWQIEAGTSGAKSLTKMGKQFVDQLFPTVANTPNASKYTVIIYLYCAETGTMDYFHVWVNRA